MRCVALVSRYDEEDGINSDAPDVVAKPGGVCGFLEVFVSDAVPLRVPRLKIAAFLFAP
jgi:hypothetical protein